MAALRRTDIDEARDQIEAWLRDGVPQNEIARRLSCNGDTLTRRLRDWNLMHLKNQGGKGHKIAWNKRDINDYLVINGPIIQSHVLKKKLWDEGLKPRECEQCGWCVYSLDRRLPLELEHINGDHYDNRIENLEILCPNCHALRLTSGGWITKDRARVAQLVEATG